MAVKKSISNLGQVTSDFTHVYFIKFSGDFKEVTSANIVSKVSEPDFEFPVIEGSINYSLGDTNSEYVKLASGENWACKRTKNDPDISFNIASNNSMVAELFSTAKTTTKTVTSPVAGATSRSILGYDAASVKVVTGALVFSDDAGNIEILPKCELTATRGKEGVAYWAVKVNPLQNSEGVNVFTVVEDNASNNVTTAYYLASSNSTGVTVNDEGWTVSVPELTSTNKYLWTYVDNGGTKSTPALIYTKS